MPSCLPLPKSSAHTLRHRPIDLFFCHSCSLWRISSATATPRIGSQRRRFAPAHPRQQQTSTSQARPAQSDVYHGKSPPNSYNSYLASRTAINAPINVSARLKPLYDNLEELKSSASNYVNLSRLQLALRGLERGQTVIRIAVLGMSGYGGMRRARRLVRLLLADPLMEQAWEEKLDSAVEQDEDGRGLLIRLVSMPPAQTITTKSLGRTGADTTLDTAKKQRFHHTILLFKHYPFLLDSWKDTILRYWSPM